MGIEPGSRRDSRNPGFVLLRRLVHFLGRDFWITSAIVLFAAILDASGLLLLAPLLAAATGRTEDRRWSEIDGIATSLGIDGLREQLALAALVFAVVMILRAVAVRLRNLRLASHNQEFIDRLRVDLVTAMAHAPWQRVPASRRSDFEHSILTDIRRVQSGSDQALRALASLAMMAAQFIAAVLISWRLSLVSMVILAGLTGALHRYIRAARVSGSDVTTTGRRTHERLSRFLAGLKLFKAHGREFKFVESYAQATAALRAHSLSFVRFQSDAEFVNTIGTGTMLAAIVLVGAAGFGLSFADVAVFALIFARLSRSFFSLFRGAQSYAYMLPALDHLLALERQFEDAGTALPERASSQAPIDTKEQAIEIVAERVSYGYDGGPAIVRDIGFRIAAGEVVALMGSSGVGKTTILDLVAGLLAPQSGTIRLDGCPIEKGLPGSLRERIAYVPQEAVFFDASLRENLQALSEPSDDEALWRMLERVEADRIPAIAAHGLEVSMGDLGQRFSGGERQRLGLARALLRKPGLLLLDEALSAVETDLERRILRAIVRSPSPLTVLLVTHRLPDDVDFDQVLTLRDGTLEVRRRA